MCQTSVYGVLLHHMVGLDTKVDAGIINTKELSDGLDLVGERGCML